MLHLDTGNTGFMILCTSLVMLMTPGLAFFYGGLVGRKNVLAIMIQSFVSMGWTTVIWYSYGYSLCFGGDWHGIIGNFQYAFLRGVDLTTPSPNDTIPAFVFIAYQMMFAIITPAADFGRVYQPGHLQGLHAVPDRLANLRVFSLRSYGLGRRHAAEMGSVGLCGWHCGA
jgi:ammonia channel protein AmtB